MANNIEAAEQAERHLAIVAVTQSAELPLPPATL